MGNKLHGCDSIIKSTLHQQLDLMSNWKSALKRKKTTVFSQKICCRTIGASEFGKKILGVKYLVCKGRSFRYVTILVPGSALLYILTKIGTYWNYKSVLT